MSRLQAHENQKAYLHKVADNCWGSERWCSDAEDETQTIGVNVQIEIPHDRKALAEAVQDLVRALPAREQMVISMLFGIDDGEHTVEEIFSCLG